MTDFLSDVLAGLRQSPKRLSSKYFYDAAGDVLFQQIMGCPEYYLTGCEREIFRTHAKEIAGSLAAGYADFDLIELGAGDGSKTTYILKELKESGRSFTYVPIDISETMIGHLQAFMPVIIPGLDVRGLHGEYLDMLGQAGAGGPPNKVVLFLGSNIGNMEPAEALDFCRAVRGTMQPGDRMLIGFDLKKHPATVLAAYNDSTGYTKAFNLNLLGRINRELGGDFAVYSFDHYPTYDPVTGACRSYLVSTAAQDVRIGGEVISFAENEIIYMEISLKYDVAEIEGLAKAAGFDITAHFTDRRKWFTDTIWTAV
jgi:dimethylhistidine N-methyltransferase